MNRSSIRFSLVISAALAVVPPALGQNWPLPAKTPNTPVPCPASSPACSGKEGLLTAPYSDPIKTFVGRYLDSQAQREWQQPFRTARARTLAIAPDRNRIYMIAGSALAAYDLPSFFTRLASGEPMAPISTAVSFYHPQRGPYPETILKWDGYFYAERSSWTIFNTDGQDRLYGFDYDDRGYVYVAYNPYGWGMLRDPGNTGGSMGQLESIWQQLPGLTDFTPNKVLSVKSNGSYYLMVSPDAGTASNVYYVGDATTTAHERRPNVSHVIVAFAKGSNNHIATLEADGRLRVYTNDAILSGQSVLNVPASEGAYSALDTDGTNFYAVSQGNFQGTTTAKLTILTADGNGNYTKQPEIDLGRPYANVPTVRYGAGYLLVFGQEGYVQGTDSAAASNLRLFKLAGTSLTPVPTLVGPAQPVNPQNPLARQYFANYYFRDSAASGYTAPIASGVDGAAMGDARIFKTGGKYYLIVAALGLGDVYELSGADSIVPKVKKVGSTANSKAAGITAPGPFYGDEITFTSTSSSSTPPSVNWTFTGDTNTYPRSPLAPDIAYQFGGLTNASFASGPVTRTATATVDANTSDSVPVQIQAPQIRIGISGRTDLLFMQPDISSPAPIVSSDQWIDASDGALESHYNDWNLDGTVSTKIPDQPQGVGACGPRTLIFTAHYGPNNAQSPSPSFTMKSTEATYGINPFKYSVQPYAVSVKEPTRDPANASNILFAAIIRTTTSTTHLPSLGSTPATYTWTLLNNDGSPAGLQQTGTATLASPTSFSVPKTKFGSSPMQVRLKVEIAPAATTCTAYALQTLTNSNLKGPTGIIVINSDGCTNLGSPCSFTFGTPNPAWHYTWSATGVGTVAGSSGDGVSFATYTPQFPVAGGYTISVTVESAIGSVAPPTPGTTATINLAQPACASSPDASNTALAYYGTANGSACQGPSDVCGLGETITFYAQPIGWAKQTCDKYDWDFGDGSAHSTDPMPTHGYTTANTYTVTMKLKGGLGPELTLTRLVHIGSSNPQPPNPQPPNPQPPNPNPGCGTLTSGSVYLGYIGAASTCTPLFGNCNPGEAISFEVHGQNGYTLGCTTHSYSWLFGDGGSSSDPAPVHVFVAANTYNVTLTLSNGSQSATIPIAVKVGNASSTCPALTAANVVPTFTSVSPTCHPGGTCAATQPISFHVDLSGYPGNCSITSYSWSSSPGGNSSSSANPSFTFPQGDYTVSVTVSNATTPNPVTVPIQIHVGPAGGACPEMTQQNVYFGWYGETTGCTPNNTDCKDSENVGFQAYATNGYSFACATHTFNWNFRDGSTPETGLALQHKFRGAGTYDVVLTITNTAGGSITLTQRVRVADAQGVTPPPTVPGARKRPTRH